MPVTNFPANPTFSYPLFGRTIAAAAGNNPNNGTPVLTPFTMVSSGTSAGGAAGVTLSSSLFATSVNTQAVANFTANGLAVWPPNGYLIQGLGQGTPYILAPWTSAVFSISSTHSPTQIQVNEVYSNIPVGTVPT